MYSARDVNIDPAMELGDGANLGGIYSVIANIDDDGSGYPSISAPGKTEFEDKFPYKSGEKRKLNEALKQIAELKKDLAELSEKIEGGGTGGDGEGPELPDKYVRTFNTRYGDVVPERKDYLEFIVEEIQEAIYESWEAEY